MRSIPRLDELPEDVAHEFTYDGRVELFFHHIHESSSSSSVWRKDQIQKSRLEFQSNHLVGSYGKSAVQEISRNIDQHMIGHVSEGHELIG